MSKMPTVFEWIKMQERFAKWQLRSIGKQLTALKLAEDTGSIFQSEADELRDDLDDEAFFFERYLTVLREQREHLHDRHPVPPYRGASRRR